MKNWEDYLIEGKNILKNKLNIKDLDELIQKENEIVLKKLTTLIYYGGMLGSFDSQHLRDIHRFLFEDIYDFAGEYREVQIFKKHPKFLEPEKIPNAVDELLEYANNLEISFNSTFEIAKFLGDLYYKLILIHPFREGNGRTIREFLREFVSYKFPDYWLDLTKINRENFLLGIIERDTYPSLLAFEINNALTKKETKKI